MTHDFSNVYDDTVRADAYATLEFPGTYYLAFRDIPALVAAHVRGTSALDFGCGAGRSTRFIRDLGLSAVGVDIAAPMIARARQRDPQGDYRLVSGTALTELAGASFDCVLSAFTFDNVPMGDKQPLFRALGRMLSPTGRIINLVSSPDIYVHEWLSFSTAAFAENRTARSGDTVLIEMRDVADRRPVRDVFCSDDDYRDIYRTASLDVVEVHRPLGHAHEPFRWVSETRVSPWAIYVLKQAGAP